MSESNNNTPMRITQLEEATAYEEGMFFAVAKAGSGTKKVSVNQSSIPLNYTKESILPYNCVEMLPLLGLTTQISSGYTFTPSSDGKKITSSGQATGASMYIFYNGNIEKSIFKAGGSYRISYSAPENAYFQIICDGSVLLNTQTTQNPIAITIPSGTTTLTIRLYLLSSSPIGDYIISFVNYREADLLEDSFVTESAYFENLKALVGYEKINFLDGINVTNDKYVNYANGYIANLSGYSVTDFFEVFYGLNYTLSYKSAGSQIAFYDERFNYVSGAITSGYNFTIPDNSNIKYARWCAETAHLSEWGLYVTPITNPNIKTINTNEGILAGVIDAYEKGIKKIFVASGTYDLIEEYKSKYGSSYFDEYTSGYNGWKNGRYDSGVWLDNIEIDFESGAVVNCNYEGNNANVYAYFSAFSVGQNVKINGLVLDAYNLRYGIHPDFHPQTNEEFLIIENCDLHHFKPLSSGPNDNQAIGAGLGVFSKWEIKNCIFRSDTDRPVVRIHNNESGNAVSNILIENCYIVGEGYIKLNSYSTSEKQTRAIVTNCSWINPVIVGKETASSNDNITLYAWNNETRTV